MNTIYKSVTVLSVLIGLFSFAPTAFADGGEEVVTGQYGMPEKRPLPSDEKEIAQPKEIVDSGIADSPLFYGTLLLGASGTFYYASRKFGEKSLITS